MQMRDRVLNVAVFVLSRSTLAPEQEAVREYGFFATGSFESVSCGGYAFVFVAATPGSIP
jgi:hypothetical protein